MSCVYGLADPISEKIRYVGKTEYEAEHRYKVHIQKAKNGSKSHVYNWIRSLSNKPILILLEENPIDINEAEKRWIAYYRSLGLDLTNKTDGGDGVSGFVASEELRRKRRELGLGRKHTLESRNAIAVALTGKPRNKHSEQTKQKMRGPRRPRTEEEKLKISVSQKERWNRNPELKVEYANRRAGKPSLNYGMPSSRKGKKLIIGSDGVKRWLEP